MSFPRSFRFVFHTACLAMLATAAFILVCTDAAAQNQAPSLEEALDLPPAAPPQPAPAAAPPAAVLPLDGPGAESVSDLLKKIENDETTGPQPQQAQQQEIVPAAPQPQPLTVAPLPIPEAPATAEAPVPAPLAPQATAVPQVVDETLTPLPAQDALANPQPLPDPAFTETAPIEGATDVVDVPAAPPGPAPDEKMFFDSESLPGGDSVPSGITRSAVPQSVNPTLEPATQMIVVTKDYEGGTEQAGLVSARRAIQLRRYDSALRIYNQLYEKNAHDPNILLGRAVVLQKLGQNEEAIRAYEDLLQVKPENIEAQINMLGLIGERYPAVALQRLEALSADNPADVRVLAQTAVIQARFGQYDEALESLGTAASMEGDNANHVYNMAVIADRAGKKEDAVRYYEKALEVDTIYGGSNSIPRESVYERLAELR